MEAMRSGVAVVKEGRGVGWAGAGKWAKGKGGGGQGGAEGRETYEV